MQIRHGLRLINNRRAAAVKLVDHARNEPLVARDNRRRQNHQVGGANGHLAVFAVGHAHQAAHRLALAARRHDYDLIVAIAVQIVNINQRVFRDIQFAQLPRQLNDVDHAAADEAELAAVARRFVNNQLNTADIRGEGRNDNAALRVAEQFAERPADVAFSHRKAGAFDVRRVRHQRKQALVAQRRDCGKIGSFAVDGRVINLEVARMQHRADGRCNRHRHRARDGVAYLDELHRESAQMHFVARIDHMKRHVGNLVLLQLVLNQAERKLGAVNRHGNPLQHIRRRADVILMSVRDQKRAYTVVIFLQIADIGNHQIDSQHILLRKNHAAVYHNDIVSIFKNGHVLSDFVNAAQWNNLQFFLFCHFNPPQNMTQKPDAPAHLPPLNCFQFPCRTRPALSRRAASNRPIGIIITYSGIFRHIEFNVSHPQRNFALLFTALRAAEISAPFTHIIIYKFPEHKRNLHFL